MLTISSESNQFENQIKTLAKTELPDFNDLLASAGEVAKQIELGQSLFLKTTGCASELEYKQQCMKSGQIMYHAHIGMNDMAATESGLIRIHHKLQERGFKLDRAGFAFDRRMGLPEDRWFSVAAETGPMLEHSNDWHKLAQSVPIQPHLGDFMIGQPASFVNTVNALRIGCTTIGNLSQFFSFEAPGWDDHRFTSAESVKAISLLANFRDQGVMLHSYLEDGYGALFKQCSTVAAWAMLEHYIVEDLIGAKLTHCIGGLTSDPVKRAGWVLALQKIHQGELVGSMIYGDTISFGSDFERNRAVTAEYLLWDILTQMYSPTGHAVLPLPVTEAIRIPSADEIIEAQCFGRQVEATAVRMFPHVDFSGAEAFADNICVEGRQVFENALSGLKQCGIDIKNPVQLLYVLKKMGPQTFEALFSTERQVNDLQKSSLYQTDMYLLSKKVVDEHRDFFLTPELRKKVEGKHFLLASTDVHEHAIGALAQLLSEAGAEVTSLGAEQSPDQLVKQLKMLEIDMVMLSTHNGMALDYAKQLKSLMQSSGIVVKVAMGGVLNQKIEGQSLPVFVTEDLKALGFHPATGLPSLNKLLTN